MQFIEDSVLISMQLNFYTFIHIYQRPECVQLEIVVIIINNN